jgi:flagellar biosynthesis protein FlhB
LFFRFYAAAIFWREIAAWTAAVDGIAKNINVSILKNERLARWLFNVEEIMAADLFSGIKQIRPPW